MTWLVLAWISWACPGGGWLRPAWPAKLRPLVCEPTPAFQLYDPARANEAYGRLAQLGAPAQLYVCRGPRCKPTIVWRTVATEEP